MSNSYFGFKEKKLAVDVSRDLPMVSPPSPPVNLKFSLVRTKETGDKIYFIENGTYHWITNPEVLTALGFKFGDDKMITRQDFQTFSQGEKITMENVERHRPLDAEVPRAEDLSTEMPKQKFKVYDEPVPPTAPQKEPEKGFTSIIIPAYLINYPIFHYTGNCIGSIREHTNLPYEIILVLNGTEEETIKFQNLQDTNADKVIQNPSNEGYAKAVNKGIRCARGEYIAIVNNDTMVFDYWLEDMQVALEELDLVMATPMYGKPWNRGKEAEELRQKAFGEPFSDFRDFACVLTRKNLFDEIGLFNEDFHMYAEDLDFLRRMDQAEKKYASTKRVNIHHIIGGTSTSLQETPQIMNESKEKLKSIWGY